MTQSTESVSRIEPTQLAEPNERISDLVAEIYSASTALNKALHPQTAANLANLVRIMNSYCCNLIEGHKTRPADIENALRGSLVSVSERRSFQIEAAAHVRVQAEIDRLFCESKLPDPTSIDFIKWLHCEFYKDLPNDFLRIQGAGRDYKMQPGAWRSLPIHDVSVGRHIPPSSTRVQDFMNYFHSKYRVDHMRGKTSKLIALATAHHRFNFIHPFPDGNGRVSRLMSHAMAHNAEIGTHGLWSISRGLARGLPGKPDYKTMMDLADTPRQGDLDGRGNLSERALIEFVEWFLNVCLDQIRFMSSLFDFEKLSRRLKMYIDSHSHLKPQAFNLLQEAFIRGEFERGDIPRITGLPERTARRVFNEVVSAGLLASNTPKGSVSLRFPTSTLEILFPNI